MALGRRGIVAIVCGGPLGTTIATAMPAAGGKERTDLGSRDDLLTRHDRGGSTPSKRPGPDPFNRQDR